MSQKPATPKGTRDFLPSDVYKRTYIFDTIKQVFQLYGFAPIETPSFELSGTFRVFHIDNKSMEHVLYFGFKDWWVGDSASFNNDIPSFLNVQAMEDSWLLQIHWKNKEKLYEEVPKLERLFRIITMRTLTVLQKRFFLTVGASAEDRYLELLERHPGIEQLIPQHQIASYLGILPESLSRMKKLLLIKNRGFRI